jgi:hypothetical protein
MDFKVRKRLYRSIEAERGTKVIAFATSDRQGMETQIAPDCVSLFVELLDQLGPVPKLSLILHTNGGQTASAWRIVNLMRTFADDFEVIVPFKALSAGTLICLGANRVVMTKQAALGPIDPSLNHPLNPAVQAGVQIARVPVSVEAVRGYIDAARDDLKVTDPGQLISLLIDLSNKIHPLVLGEIFRSRSQIRFLADRLIRGQVTDEKKIGQIIDFLCGDSGSHDYTINRREADALGLKIEKPTDDFYKLLKKIQESYTIEMKLLEPFSPNVVIGANPAADYSLVRAVLESASGGCHRFLSEGTMTKTMVPGGPLGTQEAITDQRTFEGWRKFV